MKYVLMILTITAAACLGGKLWSQARTPVEMVAAPAAVKIGVVDVGVLFRDQDRVKKLRAELEPRLKPFEARKDELVKYMKDWYKALHDPAVKLTEEQRQQGEVAIIECNRRLQDLDEKYHKEIGEQLGADMMFLDKEVQQAIRIYGVSHGYHLIMAYGEPEKPLPPNFDLDRRMTSIDRGHISFLLPAEPGRDLPGAPAGRQQIAGTIDVTSGVLDLLNSSFRAAHGLPRK